MNGVISPEVSAGSNQAGASETWMPQVSWPCRPGRAGDCGGAGDRAERGEGEDVAARDAAYVAAGRISPAAPDW